MATKAIEIESGCFASAEDDEPMFVLLARDASAPRLVREWALRRRERVAAGLKPASDMARAAEADLLAAEMEEWRSRNRS